jgi:hypothetical protein
MTRRTSPWRVTGISKDKSRADDYDAIRIRQRVRDAAEIGRVDIAIGITQQRAEVL